MSRSFWSRTAPSVLAISLGLAALSACSVLHNARLGTYRCSCEGTGCPCVDTHVDGKDCTCRASDAYGGRSNVGEPGEPGE